MAVRPSACQAPGDALPRHLHVVRLVLSLIVGLLVSGCTGSPGDDASRSTSPTASAAPSASTPAVEVPPAPREGGCHRLSLEQVARLTSAVPPVPCRRRHTAYTLHVGRLDLVEAGHSLAVDSDRVRGQLARRCLPRLDFVGGTPEQRRLSRFQVVWFSPTLAQSDAGADWFRCDLVALGDSERLLPLPTGRRLRGALDRPRALDVYGLCGTAQPGARGFERVACALRHTWVAISTIAIDGGKRYPGIAAVREVGDAPCANRVRSRTDFALKFTYGWEWPTREQWQAGQRYGFCWAPDELA